MNYPISHILIYITIPTAIRSHCGGCGNCNVLGSHITHHMEKTRHFINVTGDISTSNY